MGVNGDIAGGSAARKETPALESVLGGLATSATAVPEQEGLKQAGCRGSAPINCRRSSWLSGPQPRRVPR